MSVYKKYLNVIGIIFCFFAFISFPRTIDKTASHPITDYGQEEQLINGKVISKYCRGTCRIIISNNNRKEIYFKNHLQTNWKTDSFICYKNHYIGLSCFLEVGDSIAFEKDKIKVIKGIDVYYFKNPPWATP